MAGRAAEPPVDELVFRAAEWAAQFGGVYDNTVYPYFAQSPFCEPTSNNAVLLNQAQYNPAMVPIVATREAFESHLKTMAGVEYMIAQEPAETAPGTGTGVWVIRKQTRRKIPGREDELTVHASYFIVGENIYMAPSVFDILNSRLVGRPVY